MLPRTPVLPLFLVGALAAGPSSSAEACSSITDLSNLQLVAALPEAVESVLVMRLPGLGGDDSLLADWVRYVENPEEGADLGWDGEPDLSLVVENGAARAGLHTLVWGGSRFVAPEVVGASRADFRKILVTEQSVEPLRASLRAASDRDQALVRDEVDGMELFRAKIETRSGYDGIDVESDYVVGFLDECTILTAGSSDEVQEMANALRVGRSASRFDALAGEVDASAPVFLVRDLLPPLVDGESRRLVESEEMGMALALPDPTKPRFEIALRTDASIEEAAGYFRDVGVSYLMAEEDYELRLARGAEGYRGELVVLPHPREPYHLELITFWFFGMWMTI